MGRQRSSQSTGSGRGTTGDRPRWTRDGHRLRTDGAGPTGGNSLLTAAIVGAALLAAISVVYAVAVAPASAPYTELSLLADNGSDAALADVPDELQASGTIDPVVVVGNHRGTATTYTLLVVVEHGGGDGAVTDRRVPHRLTGSVAAGEQWRRSPSVTLSTPGEVTVRYLLFRGTAPADAAVEDADRSLAVNTRVTDGGGTATG